MSARAYSFMPTGRDPEGATLRYEILNKPSWAAFNTSTGALSGTPQAVGLWNNIRIRVTDGVNASAVLCVRDPRDRARQRRAGDFRRTRDVGGAGSSYSFTPSASDANGDPLRFSIANRAVLGVVRHAHRQVVGDAERGERGHVLQHRHLESRTVREHVALAPFSITCRGTWQSRADDQRHAGDLGHRGQRLQLPACRGGCGQQHARLQHSEQARLGDVQQRDRAAVRHADCCARRQLCKCRDQRERRQGKRRARAVRDHRRGCARTRRRRSAARRRQP